MLQLETGIRVGDKNFVGTIHFIAGDHVELCDLAGITTGTSYKNVCLLSSRVLSGSNAKYVSRHTLVKALDYLRYIADPDFRNKVQAPWCGFTHHLIRSTSGQRS